MAGEEKRKREFCFKVLVVGDCAVGKTTLINQYTKGVFYPYYKITIGADFALKVFEYNENTTITIQLWDIAGQEHSAKLSRAYYQHASAALLVFDVTRTKTLKSVSIWIDAIYEALQINHDFNFPIILLANKDDLEWDETLTTEILDSLCNNNDLRSWFPTSAKADNSIEDAVVAIVEALLEQDDCSKQEIVSLSCQCKTPIVQYDGIMRLTGSCEINGSSSHTSPCYGCSNVMS